MYENTENKCSVHQVFFGLLILKLKPILVGPLNFGELKLKSKLKVLHLETETKTITI